MMMSGMRALNTLPLDNMNDGMCSCLACTEGNYVITQTHTITGRNRHDQTPLENQTQMPPLQKTSLPQLVSWTQVPPSPTPHLCFYLALSVPLSLLGGLEGRDNSPDTLAVSYLPTVILCPPGCCSTADPAHASGCVTSVPSKTQHCRALQDMGGCGEGLNVALSPSPPHKPSSLGTDIQIWTFLSLSVVYSQLQQ